MRVIPISYLSLKLYFALTPRWGQLPIREFAASHKDRSFGFGPQFSEQSNGFSYHLNSSLFKSASIKKIHYCLYLDYKQTLCNWRPGIDQYETNPRSYLSGQLSSMNILAFNGSLHRGVNCAKVAYSVVHPFSK